MHNRFGKQNAEISLWFWAGSNKKMWNNEDGKEARKITKNKSTWTIQNIWESKETGYQALELIS